MKLKIWIIKITMEIQDYLDTVHGYMKEMIYLPIDMKQINKITPVESNVEIYTYHPYLFIDHSKSYDSDNFIDKGIYQEESKIDLFSMELISYLKKFGIDISESQIQTPPGRIKNHWGKNIITKYCNFHSIPFIEIVTIDATNIKIPVYDTTGLGIVSQIRLVKKVYLDYLTIYSKINDLYLKSKPDWFVKRKELIKEWSEKLADYLAF